MLYMYVLYVYNTTYLLHLKPNDFNKIESLAEGFEQHIFIYKSLGLISSLYSQSN